jgi:hypothetical protein
MLRMAATSGRHRFVGVPEQGGRNTISADPLPPVPPCRPPPELLGRNRRAADVQWRSVGVFAVAFYLWAFGIGLVTEYSWLNMEPWFASAVAALFGIIAPLLVPGAPPDE